jgi:hypothetical protein
LFSNTPIDSRSTFLMARSEVVPAPPATRLPARSARLLGESGPRVTTTESCVSK